MDPVSIISLVEACSSFSFTIGKLIVALINLANTYQQVALTIRVLTNECKTIAVVITNLQRWIKSQVDENNVDAKIWDQLRESIQLGELVVAAFEEELRPMSDPRAVNGFRRKTRAAWALSTLKEHENRVRGQFGGLTLLLQIVNLPSSSSQAKLLEEQAQVFRTASESAWTILDSNASISTWRASASSTESLDISYKPLDFENLLFTSFVYKRNFRIKRAVRSKKAKVATAPRGYTSNIRTENASVHSTESLPPHYTPSALSGIGRASSDDHWQSEAQLDDARSSLSLILDAKEPGLCPIDTSRSGGLIRAVKNGELERTRKVMVKGVSVNGIYRGQISSKLPWGTPVDHRSYSLLQLAVGMKQTAIVALLLTRGAMVDLRTSPNPRPMILACQSGNLEVVKLLVEHDAFIDFHPSDDDHAPIHAAVTSGNAQLVKYLCSLGTNTEVRTKTTGYKPLELACLFGVPWVLETLLETGTKPPSSYNSVPSWIRQPHIMAILEGNTATIEKLVVWDPIAFLQQDPSSGSTVLHDLFDGSFPNRSNFLERLRLLLSCPGLVSLPDNLGNLPLHIAAEMLDAKWKYSPIFVEEVICMLVAAGADVHALNHAGHDALYVACLGGGEIAVATLLKCGASVIPRSDLHSYYGAILRPKISMDEWSVLHDLLSKAVEEQSVQQPKSDKTNFGDPIPFRQAIEVMGGAKALRELYLESFF